MTSVEISERNSSFPGGKWAGSGPAHPTRGLLDLPMAIHSFVHERYQMALSDFRIR